MTAFTEPVVEEAALASLEGLGYAVRHGAELTPDGSTAKRKYLGQVFSRIARARRIITGRQILFYEERIVHHNYCR